MTIDEKALHLVQDRYAATNGKYKDMSIREIIEDYESLKSGEQPDELAIKRLLVEALQTAHTEDDYSYHNAADDLYLLLRPFLCSTERESSDVVERIKAAAHEARGYLCARPANKPKANTILLRIVQGGYDHDK